jgi:hypothetical protein
MATWVKCQKCGLSTYLCECKPDSVVCSNCESLESRLKDAEVTLMDCSLAIVAMLGIVHDSNGVEGYHLNGDTALWNEFPEIAEVQNVSSIVRAYFEKYKELPKVKSIAP